MRKLAAESIGTFALVFAGTGAITINDVTGGAVTHVGVALTFGLVVMAMIYAVGDVSGAHLNPAVTIAFWVAGRFEGNRVAPAVGAAVAVVGWRCVRPESASVGTIPQDTPIVEGGRRKRVLFVCVENSNRSQMAEAFARIEGKTGVEAFSAGSRPSGRVNLKAV